MQEITDLVLSMYQSGARLSVVKGELQCYAPKGTLSVEQIALLRERKAEIIALLTQARPLEAGVPDLVTRSPNAPAPLSVQQELFWNLSQFGSKDYSPLHWITGALRLRGMLNVDFLRRSLGTVAQRNASLRTRICLVDGVPHQMISEPAHDLLKLVNVKGESENDVDSESRRILEMFFRRQVDLTTGPLFESLLLRVTECEHVLAIVMHHIISDAVSMELFFKYLWIEYVDLLRGSESSLNKKPLQYTDYAVWQRSRQTYWLEKGDEYWNRRLASAVCAHLPVDSGLENMKPFSVSQSHISLGEELSCAIRSLARKERVLPALVILALYASLISHWSNQRDFVIGLVVDGRYGSEHANVLGLFAHGVPLRLELSGNEMFADLLQVISREHLAALEHLESYETLELGKHNSVPPDFFRGPWLNWTSESAGVPTPPELNGHGSRLNIEQLPIETALPASHIDLREVVFVFSDGAQGISGSGRFRADLFSSNTIQRFMDDFRRSAEQVVQDPLIRMAGLLDRRPILG